MCSSQYFATAPAGEVIKRTVKFWLLQDLDFADVDVMKGINALTDLLNVLADAVWNPAAFSTSTQLYNCCTRQLATADFASSSPGKYSE